MELNNLTVKEAMLRTEAAPASRVCGHDGQRANRLQLLDTSQIKPPPEAALRNALCPRNCGSGGQQHGDGARGICRLVKCSADAPVPLRPLESGTRCRLG